MTIISLIFVYWCHFHRDLLVCIRFDERGGQWSGSFLPDCLGDAQVKVRNHVSGALDMVRVEIQNANMLINETKDVGASTGNSGTYLILLSDDDSGFMPYRIDNFSMEVTKVLENLSDDDAVFYFFSSILCPLKMWILYMRR